MKAGLRWSLAALAVVAAILLLRARLWTAEPVPVRAPAVTAGQVERTLVNSSVGTVHARTRAALTPGASGIVSELNVRRGDRVKRGDALLRLAPDTQAAQLELAEREVAVAEARNARACVAAERAARELERFRTLEHEAIVSPDRLDQLESAWQLARSDCDVAAAEVSRAQSALALARAELDKTVLVAPFDAIIAEVSVELGEWVTPSVPLMAAPDVIDALDPSSIYVSAPMDEVDSRLLAAGLVARVTLDSIPERSFPAHVTHIAPFVLDVEQQNRTVEIEVELDDPGFAATLLPGTSADVEVVLDVRENVLRVPTHALLEGGRVLVLADGRAEERRLELGLRNWDWSEVVRGLAPGERVITSLEREGVAAGAAVVLEEDGAAGERGE
jgi:HlyD family secretion protein